MKYPQTQRFGINCCRRSQAISSREISIKSLRQDTPPQRHDSTQSKNSDESNPDLEERIKNLDFMTMLISFICFVTFASIYWTVLWGIPSMDEKISFWTEINLNLINNWRMFNGATDDLAEKPYIPHKSLLQWICCKCLAWWHGLKKNSASNLKKNKKAVFSKKKFSNWDFDLEISHLRKKVFILTSKM